MLWIQGLSIIVHALFLPSCTASNNNVNGFSDSQHAGGKIWHREQQPCTSLLPANGHYCAPHHYGSTTMNTLHKCNQYLAFVSGFIYKTSFQHPCWWLHYIQQHARPHFSTSLPTLLIATHTHSQPSRYEMAHYSDGFDFHWVYITNNMFPL